MSVACHPTRNLHRLYHLVSFAAPSNIFSLMSQPRNASVRKMEFLLRTSLLGHTPAQQSQKNPAATGSPHKLGVEHHRPLRLRGSQNLVQLPPPQPHHDGLPVLLHHLVHPSQQRQQLCPTRLPLQQRRWHDARAHPTPLGPDVLDSCLQGCSILTKLQVCWQPATRVLFVRCHAGWSNFRKIAPAH